MRIRSLLAVAGLFLALALAYAPAQEPQTAARPTPQEPQPAARPAPQRKIRTETIVPDMLGFYSGKNGKTIVVTPAEAPRTPGTPYRLYDDVEAAVANPNGLPPCVLKLDGKLTDRLALLDWFDDCKTPSVTLVIDDWLYGRVIEARFQSKP